MSYQNWETVTALKFLQPFTEMTFLEILFRASASLHLSKTK